MGKRDNKMHSLKFKLILMVIIIALLLNGATIYVTVKGVTDIGRNNYETTATNLAKTTAAMVDAEALQRLVTATMEIYGPLTEKERVFSDQWGSDEFYAYLERFADLEKTKDFLKVHDQLRRIQDANDVDCVYIAYVDPKTKGFIYIVDAAEEDPCPIGCLDPLYEENYALLKDPTIGFPVYTTSTEEYGNLATAGAPIYSSRDSVVAYAMVDISTDDVAAWRNRIVSMQVLLEAILTIIICILAVVWIRRFIIRPINQLSAAADAYREEEDATEHKAFAQVDIHTKDEIQGLSESMQQMERDLNEKITNLLQTTIELTATRREADEMNALAKKDALTGVRNKLAYDEMMASLNDSLQDGEQKLGIAVIDLNDLKAINDTYGHEKGDIAISSLCRTICMVFVHSPVFRIGGDEFAVILRESDYDNVEELVLRFHSAMQVLLENGDLDPWEKVNAAIGFARYDEEKDGDLGGTFRRADRAMYMNKFEMKKGAR